MKRWLQRPELPTVLAIALVVLLVLLAVLQYRWTGELSRGEREQMRRSLESSLEAIAKEVDQELTGLVFTVQRLTGPRWERAVSSWPQALESWRQETAFPELVKGVYVADLDSEELLALGDGEHQTVPWPEELLGLRERLLAGEEGGSDPRGVWPLDAIAPAVILPVPEGRRPSPRGGGGAPPFLLRGSSGFSISKILMIQLDPQVLEQEMPDALAERYLPESSGFDLLIRRLADDTVIYRRGTVAETSRGDAVIGLLRLRVPEGPPGEEGGRDRRWQRRGPTREDSRPELFQMRSLLSFARRAREPRWELVAVHSQGSLDAAVAQARLRNLGVSLGILVLLSASLALLLHSTRRSRRLARQQLEFVAGVTHELLTPLAAMRSAGQNLADGVVQEPEQVARYGRLVDTEGKRLADMVGQVLALAGMGFGERAPERGPVAVGELFRRVQEDFAAELESAGFEVELAIEEPEPVIDGDFEALRRALGNLVGNALKYAASGTWLRLAAHRVGRRVELVVADRGSGIASEDQPHIFEPFRRGRGLSASTIPGSGLGLSLVRSTVEGHGGTVHLDSSAEGTTFTLRLPALDGPSASELAHGVHKR